MMDMTVYGGAGEVGGVVGVVAAEVWEDGRAAPE